ncbi:MAG: DUF3040 domain-containing protein [Micrococcales bacterium]|nr:DUF3040 domain-containing protein [Micrococcales bacterium]MCL2667354.1 DUF3040 domain-containing protein [Micrococcales bacterium]
MPLSEYEQRVLDQMERHLSTEDPHLANRLTQRARPVTRYLVAAVGTLVGILALVFGVGLKGQLGVVLGVAGFIMMFAAVAYAFSGSGSKAAAQPQAAAPPTPRSSRPARRSLMDVFEERWNRRRDQR